MARRGSSPLARGLLFEYTDTLSLPGIIPARAGFTSASSTPPPTPSDHPRSRGVYPRNQNEEVANEGSSPLARGLQENPAEQSREGRIIPARAGFTSWFLSVVCGVPDHPRSRGVYPHPVYLLRTVYGSSPLARGLPVEAGRERRRLRIIPARAGFTHNTLSPSCLPPDHPRSRGVYVLGFGVQRPDHGSSPLARGLHAAHRPPL